MLTLTRLCVCVCVFVFVHCRCGLHNPDAAGQFELVHKPVDLHSLLQQHVQRASEPAALLDAAESPRLPAGRLHHDTHLHHQGQPVLRNTDGT